MVGIGTESVWTRDKDKGRDRDGDRDRDGEVERGTYLFSFLIMDIFFGPCARWAMHVDAKRLLYGVSTAGDGLLWGWSLLHDPDAIGSVGGSTLGLSTMALSSFPGDFLTDSRCGFCFLDSLLETCWLANKRVLMFQPQQYSAQYPLSTRVDKGWHGLILTRTRSDVRKGKFNSLEQRALVHANTAYGF